MDSAFCTTQINLIKGLIEAYQAVLLQIAQNPNKSYSLDTGQTKETVSKHDVADIRDIINGLVGDLQFWYDCLNNTGTTIVRPSY